MGFRSPPAGYIDVGRSTIYGNPFRPTAGPGSSIPRFREYAEARMLSDPAWAASVRSLRGHTLVCPGCGINSPTCHARVLEELARR